MLIVVDKLEYLLKVEEGVQFNGNYYTRNN
jgi:hypothetical protein